MSLDHENAAALWEKVSSHRHLHSANAAALFETERAKSSAEANSEHPQLAELFEDLAKRSATSSAERALDGKMRKASMARSAATRHQPGVTHNAKLNSLAKTARERTRTFQSL